MGRSRRGERNGWARGDGGETQDFVCLCGDLYI